MQVAHGRFAPARLLLLASALSVASGACSEAGKSLVALAIEADPMVSGLATVDVHVNQVNKDNSEIAFKTFAWTKPGQVNRFGIFVPKGTSGAVTVTVKGKNAAGDVIASVTSSSVMLVPGAATTDIPLTLMPSAPGDGPDGGTGGSGNGGTTGTGGNGSGGAAGTGGGPGTGGGSAGATGSGGARTGGAGGGATGTGGGAAGAPGPGWRGPKMIEPDMLVANWTPAVAVDAMGNAVVVYRHGTGVRAARYTAATDSWAAPVGIETRSGGQAYSPQIGVDKNGQWLVIWQQDENMSLKGLWQSTSSDGTTWAAPAAITTAPAFDPTLAVNKEGMAVAAWYGRDPTAGNFPATASIRNAGMWSTPTVMKAANTANGFPLQTVAITGTGEAYVVWQDTDGGTAGQDSIWMRRYASGTWSAAALVESYDAGGADTQTVAANASGQVIITWRQSGATVNELWARRYTTGGAATAPVLVAQAEFIPWDLSSSTIDDAGVSTVVFSVETQKVNAYVGRAPHTQPFPADPVALESDNQAATMNNNLVEAAKIYPVIGSDSAGNVTVVWRKSAGTRFDLYSRRFSNGAWGPPALVEDQNTGSVPYPVLAVGLNGTAVAAWYYEGDGRIWANVLR